MRDITMSDMNEAVLYGKVHGSCQLSAGRDFWYSWGHLLQMFFFTNRGESVILVLS